MNVNALIELLQRQNPNATVVVCDRVDFVRAGLLRPLRLSELQVVQLGEVVEDEGTWLCEWSERSSDREGPIPGVLIGPR